MNSSDVYSLILLADRDYLTARLLNFCGGTMYPQAAYHSQQSIEKYIKALLVQYTGKFPKGHNLNELRKECATFLRILNRKEVKNLITKFDELEQVSRYGPFSTFDPMAKKVVGQFETKGVFMWQNTYIKELDKLVYKLRGKVDFADNIKADNLLAVLSEDNSIKIVSDWRLKFPSLKDVLTFHNDYYK